MKFLSRFPSLRLKSVRPRRLAPLVLLLGMFGLAATLADLSLAELSIGNDSNGPATVASTFMVLNTNDAGAGSLRQAILDANSNLGADVIGFSIASGLQTIAPTTSLPDISDPVVIDGTTQPGFAGTPLIELSGANTPSAPSRGLLHITGGNTTVRGLVINRFKGAGIALLTNGGNQIEGNYVGTDVTGNGATTNGGNGININDSPNNTIGGLTLNARNVISKSGFHGISIFNPGATGNVVQGNYIGVNTDGSAGLGNAQDGILLAASNNTIGGTSPSARNIISANSAGIVVAVAGTTGNLIQGNYIGTDASGTHDLGNSTYGIAIFNPANNNTIGGTTPGARNVISGNEFAGISFTSSGGAPSGNVVQGNYIGIGADGTTPLGNSIEGIRLAGALNTTVGGTEPEAGNTVAFNGGATGWGIEAISGTGNSIRGNSIFSNAGLGIDLNADGVTANEAGDSDTGSNNRQNFPVITSVVSNSSQTTISGTINSTPESTFAIDFYSNAACDPSGNGEGAAPFAIAPPVTTDANGNGDFNVLVPVPLSAGRVITATATDSSGNTSEFSPCSGGNAIGSVQFGAVAYRVIEDVGFATITVTRASGSLGTLAVDYSTEDITAIAGQDYAAASGTLTFASGETSKTFEIPIFDDVVDEPDESFRIVLRNTLNIDSLGHPSVTVVTVQDHNTVPLVSLSGGSVNEGNSGLTNAVFTATLSAATGRTVTVNFATAGLTATSGIDFQAASGSITFNPRVTTRTIEVPVIGDTTDEFDETFQTVISNPVNATLGNNGAIETILDDDPPPLASISDVSVTEGNSNVVFAIFSLTLSTPSGKSVCVQANTADGTATAGSDYFAGGGIIFFDNGNTTASVVVQVRGDAAFEPDETFFVNLTPCNATVAIGRGQAVGTIINDDPPSAPYISISDANVSDGAGPANAVFNVTLSTSSTQTVTVNYAAVAGTASSGGDFQPAAGMLTFNPGTTSQTITVPIVPDSLTEGNETFFINLTDSVSATLADGQGLGTISDGPPSQLPTISISDVTVNEGDSGSASVDFTVTLSTLPPNGGQVSFQFAAAPGTATANVDYSNVFGASLFFNTTVRTISVPIRGDTTDEFDETFFINLSNATNGATFADAQGMATIIDNDPPPTVSISDVSVNEGHSGTTSAAFAVNLSEPSGKPVSVNYETADGSASAGADYTAATGTVTFNPGETSKSIAVTINSDPAYDNEPNETFFVNLSTPINVLLADVQGVGTIINTASSIQFSSTNFSKSEGGGSTNITVTRAGDVSGASSVDFRTGGNGFGICNDFQGLAVQSCDFVTTGGTLVFAAGQTSRTFPVLIYDDAYAEGNETLDLFLSNAVGSSLGVPETATLTILENDLIAAVPDWGKTFIADMYSTSTVPPTFTTARGTGIVQLDTAENSSRVGLIFSNLSSPQTEAHLHGPASEQANGPIVASLPPGPVKNFSVNLTTQQVSDLKAGQQYLDVHTSNYSNGEDRGQLVWNPLNEATYFVTQHYLDFLGRLPDQGGLDYWTNEIASCGADVQCFRERTIGVSNAFFYEDEYQQTASYVFLLYRAAYGNDQPFPNPDQGSVMEAKKLPRYLTFVRDRGRVVGGANLAASQKALADIFVQRPEFVTRYPLGLATGPQFVDAVLATIQGSNGVTLSAADRTALLAHYDNGGRALVMFHLSNDYWNGCNRLPGSPAAPCVPAGYGVAVDNRVFIDAEYNRSFVFSQYSGYLRRDADIGGFIFWLNQVSSAPPRNVAKQHGMVCAFITSTEYQVRFRHRHPRNNAECIP